MNFSREEILTSFTDTIMAYCFNRYPDQLTEISECFDTKIAEIGQIKDKIIENEMADNLISDIFLLVVDTYATSILAIIGILLNIQGCWQLLSRRQRKKVFNLMLAVTLSFDILYLSSKLLRSLEMYLPIPKKNLWLYYSIVNSGIRFSLSSSTLMMVAIGRVRYDAIRKPVQQRMLFLSSKQRIQVVIKHLIPILVMSSIFSFPIFFEIDNGTNELGEDNMELTPSKMRRNRFYSFFTIGILNLGLLGTLPFACLIYFAYKIMVLTRERQSQNRESIDYEGLMNAIGRKVSKSLVVVIITFITLHSPRIIASVGELHILMMQNKDDIALKLGHGIPMWLQVLAPISELCTVLNACANIIIYKYMNSTNTLRCSCPLMCIKICVQRSASAGASSSLPYQNEPPRHIQGDEDESRHLRGDNIVMDVVNETCTFKIYKKGTDFI